MGGQWESGEKNILNSRVVRRGIRKGHDGTGRLRPPDLIASAIPSATTSGGERGPAAFIAKLMGISDPNPTPYAELWVGAHPSAPSQILRDETDSIPLNDAVRLWPLPILGPRVQNVFGGQWPFLLKILSAAEALSIQAHPDRTLAPLLHAQDPLHYPDANHKPELAVALETFRAVAGFKPLDGWRAVFRAFPEIASFVGPVAHEFDTTNPSRPETVATEGIFSAKCPPAQPRARAEDLPSPIPERAKEASRSGSPPGLVQAAFLRLLTRAREDPTALAAVIQATAQRMGKAPEPFGSMAALFHELLTKYGPEDVGLLVLLFLNPLELVPGQAVFLPPGLPHAYLRGNIVECMANSDNVVRLGLTPKPKDFQMIPRVLHFDPIIPEVITPSEETHTVYAAPCSEFQVHRWIVGPDRSLSITRPDGPEVILVIEGRGQISWREDDRVQTTRYGKGSSFLIPALLPSYQLEAKTRTFAFTARVPPLSSFQVLTMP